MKLVSFGAVLSLALASAVLADVVPPRPGSVVIPAHLLGGLSKVKGMLGAPALDCDSKDAPAWMNLVNECSRTDRATRNEFLQVLGDLRATAGLVALPSRLNVNLCSGMTQYDAHSNTMEFNTVWEDADTGQPMDRKYAYGVMAHEYGHAVFETGMRVNPAMSRWRAFQDDHLKAGKRADEIQSELRGRGQSLPRLPDGVSIDWDQVRKTHQDLDQAYRYMEKSEKMYIVMQAYSELFGDLLASIHARDPKVIHNAIRNSKSDDRHRRVAEARDFSREIDTGSRLDLTESFMRHWSDYSDQLKAYELFSPSYHAIWKALGKQVESRNVDRRLLVRSVFDILGTDFQENFGSYDAIENIDPIKLNERLSGKFREMRLASK